MPGPKKFVTPGKKHKRTYGEGALYRRSDGMWVGQLSLPPGPDGSRQRSKPVYSRDKARCQEKLDKLKHDLEAGIPQVAKRKITVETRITRWADRNKPHWSPNHHRNVLSTIRNQIVPAIGQADFKTLTTDHIDYFVSWMAAQTASDNNGDEKPKWSSRTRQIAFDRVREWLDDELKERPKLIRENVAALVDRPKASSTERGTHTDTQARTVLETALGWGDPLVTLWAARYLTGLRQGELLGMQEDRIDWENLTWDISWQLQQLPLKPGMKHSDSPDRFDIPDTYDHIPLWGNLALTAPKTRKARIQPLPPEFALMLKIYLENRIPNEFGLVWVTESFKPVRREYENEAWRDAQTRAEVPVITGHGTRHTANTLIPVDETHRMKFLGQSTAAANRIYLHEDLEKLREGQNALAGMLLPEKIIPESHRRIP